MSVKSTDSPVLPIPIYSAQKYAVIQMSFCHCLFQCVRRTTDGQKKQNKATRKSSSQSSQTQNHSVNHERVIVRRPSRSGHHHVPLKRADSHFQATRRLKLSELVEYLPHFNKSKGLSD